MQDKNDSVCYSSVISHAFTMRAIDREDLIRFESIEDNANYEPIELTSLSHTPISESQRLRLGADSTPRHRGYR